MEKSDQRYSGVVKFFNCNKGYGFILPNGVEGIKDNEEVFVHHTAIVNESGFKSLSEGQTVEFYVFKGAKGWQASNVTGPNGEPIPASKKIHNQPNMSPYSYYAYYNAMYNPYYMQPPNMYYMPPPPPSFHYNTALPNLVTKESSDDAPPS